MKKRLASFQYKGIVVIAAIFVVIAAFLFAERSGIRYNYNTLALRLLPNDKIITAKEAWQKQEKNCLVLWDSADIASQETYEEFQAILGDMRIGYDAVDLRSAQDYSFEGYQTAVVILQDLSALSDNLIVLCDWVYDGGGALFPMTLMKETYFSVIEAKLGINDSSYDNALVDSIYVEESFMVGGGRSFVVDDSWDSALAIQLEKSDRVKVYAYTSDKRKLPLIWQAQYGEGSFVVDNFGWNEKAMRGFFAASYSLLNEVCVYPVINGSAFYLDDFPSQIPLGNSEYIQRDYATTIRDFYVNIWWPDMMNFADRYGLQFTGLAIESYNDDTDGTVAAAPDKGTFSNLGGMLLRQGGEIGYHGYNHQPLCLGNCDYKGLYDYKTWKDYDAMESGFDELISFCNELFPGVLMQIYVPPSNLLSTEGREFVLKEYPFIQTISGIYFEDDELDFECVQEFSVSENGVVDQPRIISGCYLESFMQLAAISELNYHFVNSHFTHPDDALDPDRGAEMGWEALKTHFNEYLNWLYSSAPTIRNFTGTELSAAVQRYAALSPSTEVISDRMVISLDGFVDEAQLMVRFNEKLPKEVVGGSLQKLTDTLYLVQASEAVVTVLFE